MPTSPRRTRATTVAALGSAAVLALSACGSVAGSNGPEASDGLPDVVQVVSVNPTTGPIAFAGGFANKGYELAVKEINETDFLEGSTLELSLVDTKSEPQTAAAELTKVIADNEVSAVFGAVASQEAVAMSPLAEDRGMPIVYTQAGTDGVLLGDYTYRATPRMGTYYPLLNDFITEQGAETVAVMSTEANPLIQDLANDTIPAMAEDLGLEITANVRTQATTQDYAAPISQMLRTDPDVVIVLLNGVSNPTAMTQLRQAGWDGPVLGNPGAGTGNLDPAGADGAGMVWATDFHPDMSSASTQAFTEAYVAEYGEEPNNYAAEAYDAAWFLARAVKEAGSADRESIMEAMAVVAEETYDGALGEGLSWVDHEMTGHGAVVEHTLDGEVLLYEGEPTA